MGEDFWRNLKTVSFLQYLKNKGVTADTYWFTEVLQKMFNTSISKMTSLGTLNRPFERKSAGPKVSLIRHSKHKKKEESSRNNTDNRNSKESVISPLQISSKISNGSNLPINRESSFDSSDNQNSTPKLAQVQKRSSKSAAKLKKALSLSTDINSESDSESYQSNDPSENSPFNRDSSNLRYSEQLPEYVNQSVEKKSMDSRSEDSLKSKMLNLPSVAKNGGSASNSNSNVPSQKSTKLLSPNSLEPVKSIFASTTVNTIIRSSLEKLTSQDDSSRSRNGISNLDEGNRKSRFSLSALDSVPAAARDRESLFNVSSEKLQSMSIQNEVTGNNHSQSEIVQSPRRLKRLESYEKSMKKEEREGSP